jgi:glycosyltransferase involved in cell wall biosynthesis
MTRSPKPLMRNAPPSPRLGRRWLEQAERSQEAALPSGSIAVSCSAPLGTGGLGRHLKELVDACSRSGRSTACICGSSSDTDPQPRRRGLGVPDPASLLARSPVPLSPGLRARASAVDFDEYAARRLPAADHLIAFNGQALAQLRAAGRAHYVSTSLVSANSHLRRVVRQHAQAHRQYPLERSWATSLLRRNLAEYRSADRIFVASEYTRESFIEEGFPDESLSHFQFTPDPRFAPATAPRSSDVFNIVYVGSLTVAKGVPLLVDAVRRLPYADIRLVLVGGWASRGMRLFIQRSSAEDPRISSGPGDPLPHLREARLYVHPSYEDGFAYAPAEALACGVPVIVSNDTGMKELIDPGNSGLVVPTGDLDALTEALEAAYRGEVLASRVSTARRPNRE